MAAYFIKLRLSNDILLWLDFGLFYLLQYHAKLF